MQVIKIITHANGGDDYRLNAMRYCLDERCILKKGYGVDIRNPETAAMHFRNVDAFWNKYNKNPFIQYMISFDKETVSTPEEAMRLTQEIMEPTAKDHLTLCVAHKSERADSLYHTHSYAGATNIHNGSMIYSDNKTNCAMAQRAADVIGKPVRLVVDYGKGKEWECNSIFVPAADEDDE